MYVCMYLPVYVYVSTCVCVCVCARERTRVCMSCACVCMYVWVRACACACTCYVCVWLCACVRTCVCMPCACALYVCASTCVACQKNFLLLLFIRNQCLMQGLILCPVRLLATHCFDHWFPGLARTVYVHRTWPYIWWNPCKKYRTCPVYIIPYMSRIYKNFVFWPNN